MEPPAIGKPDARPSILHTRLGGRLMGETLCSPMAEDTALENGRDVVDMGDEMKLEKLVASHRTGFIAPRHDGPNPLV